MGSEEVVIYFELCRYLIGRGWEWLGNPERSKSSTEFSPDCMMDSVADLVAFLDQAKEEFLTSPFEGGSSPNFILQCSRRRVPRSSEIAIEGIEEQERSEHTNDCDCPICLMLADGDFGPSFTSLDGYHLELDEEFAFSLFETYQQWQEESLFHCDDEDSDDSDPASEADDMDADADADDDSESDNSEGQGPTANQSRADEHLPIDEFASAWDGIRSTEPLPGDTLGHIKLAFMLAEIVSHLQSRKVQPQIIRGLNAAFVRYRQASDRETIAAKATLVERLELLTVRYPQLVPRIADFQSHLDLTVNRTVP